jgi:hypothetical protein
VMEAYQDLKAAYRQAQAMASFSGGDAAQRRSILGANVAED